jgi:steroid delta-isomerase
MPSSTIMKSALHAYIDAFNGGSAEAVAALYADDAAVEDPVGTPPRQGRAAILDFYRGAIATGAKLTLDSPVRGSHGNSAAMAFTVTVGPITVRVIDVMTFDETGKITSMKAYFAPDDITQSDH